MMRPQQVNPLVSVFEKSSQNLHKIFETFDLFPHYALFSCRLPLRQSRTTSSNPSIRGATTQITKGRAEPIDTAARRQAIAPQTSQGLLKEPKYV